MHFRAHLTLLERAVAVAHTVSHVLYKADKHSSSSCNGTFGLLHFMKMIFAVLVVIYYVTLTLCYSLN